MPPPDPKLRLLVRHSASPKDVTLAEELLGHLRPLARFAGVDVWSEARIQPGDDWREAVQQAIDGADVALLLLSADFLSTDGLVGVEVPRLLERHRGGNLRVIPVVLRHCAWKFHPWLSDLHPLPRGGRALGSFSGDARDEVLAEVVKEIASALSVDGPPSPSDDARDRQWILDQRDVAAQHRSADDVAAMARVGDITREICRRIVRRETGLWPPSSIDELGSLVELVERGTSVEPFVRAQLRAIQAYGDRYARSRDGDPSSVGGFMVENYLPSAAFAALNNVCSWYFRTYFKEMLPESTVDGSGLISLAALREIEESILPPDRVAPFRADGAERLTGLGLRALAQTTEHPGERAEGAMSAYGLLKRTLERETDGDTQGAIHDYHRLVEIALRDGDTAAAILFARRMVLLDPHVPAHRIELAELYARDGRVGDALDVFEAVAQQLQEGGDQRQFVKVAERIVCLQPDNYKVCQGLARVYVQRRDWGRSLRTLSRCLAMSSSDVEILTMLARSFEGLGERAKAIQVWVEIARQSQVSGDADQARIAYERAKTLRDSHATGKGS
jgi:tetratricopeptide (TPR) repeat protein